MVELLHFTAFLLQPLFFGPSLQHFMADANLQQNAFLLWAKIASSKFTLQHVLYKDACKLLYAHSSFVLLERNFREKAKCFQPLRLFSTFETTKAKNISYAFAFQISLMEFSVFLLTLCFFVDSSYSTFLGSFFSSSVSCVL